MVSRQHAGAGSEEGERYDGNRPAEYQEHVGIPVAVQEHGLPGVMQPQQQPQGKRQQ